MFCYDDCKYYHWYYDWCDRWQCEVDAREVYNSFESYNTPILNAMVNGEINRDVVVKEVNQND